MSSVRIGCPKDLNQETGRALLEDVRERMPGEAAAVILDFAETESIDTFGAAWMVDIARFVSTSGAEFKFEGHHGSVAEFIDLIGPGLTGHEEHKEQSENIFEKIGGESYSIVEEAKQILNLFIDAVYWTFIGPVEGKGLRWGLVAEELYEMGVRALWINSIMNVLLGLIVAMLSAAQLRRVGLDIYVADLTVIAFARELAVVMTALVVSARTGAAIAAELATMKVQEEIDALRGMGLKVPQFLVAPKVLALLVALPCLTVIAMYMGVFGGAIWGVGILGFSTDVWIRQTINAVTQGDVFQGLLKSFFFAAAIVLIGCHNGLRVTGGSRGVGLMTTRAVVMDIFVIVVIDMIFAVVFYYVL
ncbi:MAG TPA: ABC transporter permease [Candidatus Hydrogenedentes bacterium]|nr:ABC transporter permease [Candidatus Hydrogenedentota bacterium]HQH51164.1 ABC transporter permease [Candidatus Hydrogenedentota bacterium]HQM47470.1 ABC transporter permease [Candidatus Hydrogenedentota bacterium]